MDLCTKFSKVLFAHVRCPGRVGGELDEQLFDELIVTVEQCALGALDVP